MNQFEAAIAARRVRIAELTTEIDQLLQAEKLVGKVVDSLSVKPPPRAEAKPVRAETPRPPAPAPKQKRSYPGDPNFACGHSRDTENQTTQGRCRICSNASKDRWREKYNPPKKKRSPKTDPAPLVIESVVEVAANPTGLVLSEADRLRLLKDTEKKTRAPKATRIEPAQPASPAPASAVVAPPNPVTVAGAKKWQKQCVARDIETGAQCSLLHPHALPHSSSGRTFRTSINPDELPRGRELDRKAVEGSKS